MVLLVEVLDFMTEFLKSDVIERGVIAVNFEIVSLTDE